MPEAENDFDRAFMESPEYGKYLEAMAEQEQSRDPEFQAERIDELEKQVKELTKLVEKLSKEFDGHCSGLYAHGDPECESGGDDFSFY